jgi:hypothetical protein
MRCRFAALSARCAAPTKIVYDSVLNARRSNAIDGQPKTGNASPSDAKLTTDNESRSDAIPTTDNARSAAS